MDKNEAIKIIRSNFPTGRKILCEALEILIPELKESEDERIRKEIIQSIQDNMCVIHKDKCIAWLEKQGEQKSTWSEEDENGFGDALWAIQQAKTITKNENEMGGLWYAENWLKSLKERMKGE